MKTSIFLGVQSSAGCASSTCNTTGPAATDGSRRISATPARGMFAAPFASRLDARYIPRARAVCVRLPPTLKATAAHVFDMVLNLERFQVTQTTSYDHFLYAYMSGRVSFAQLVPDPARCVLRRHRYHRINKRRYHTRCVSPMWALLMPPSRTQFANYDDALTSFIFKRRWWCFVCDRPLFECAPCHNRDRPPDVE